MERVHWIRTRTSHQCIVAIAIASRAASRWAVETSACVSAACARSALIIRGVRAIGERGSDRDRRKATSLAGAATPRPSAHCRVMVIVTKANRSGCQLRRAFLAKPHSFNSAAMLTSPRFRRPEAAQRQHDARRAAAQMRHSSI